MIPVSQAALDNDALESAAVCLLNAALKHFFRACFSRAAHTGRDGSPERRHRLIALHVLKAVGGVLGKPETI